MAGDGTTATLKTERGATATAEWGGSEHMAFEGAAQAAEEARHADPADTDRRLEVEGLLDAAWDAAVTALAAAQASSTSGVDVAAAAAARMQLPEELRQRIRVADAATGVDGSLAGQGSSVGGGGPTETEPSGAGGAAVSLAATGDRAGDSMEVGEMTAQGGQACEFGADEVAGMDVDYAEVEEAMWRRLDEVSRPAVAVMTVVYRQLEMLEWQHGTLKAFLEEDFVMVVAIDSPPEIRPRFIDLCLRLGILCLGTPFSDDEPDEEGGGFARDRNWFGWPSFSHTRAANWLWREAVLPRWSESRVMLLDPDAFLLRPFSVSRPFANHLAAGETHPQCDIVGLHQYRVDERTGMRADYLHVAALVLNAASLPDAESLSFEPINLRGVAMDSGGAIGAYLERYGVVEWPSPAGAVWSAPEGGPGVRVCYFAGGYLNEGALTNKTTGHAQGGCFLLGGLCRSDQPGGCAACPPGQPDLWHHGTILHTRRSSGWEDGRADHDPLALSLARHARAHCLASFFNSLLQSIVDGPRCQPGHRRSSYDYMDNGKFSGLGLNGAVLLVEDDGGQGGRALRKDAVWVLDGVADARGLSLRAGEAALVLAGPRTTPAIVRHIRIWWSWLPSVRHDQVDSSSRWALRLRLLAPWTESLMEDWGMGLTEGQKSRGLGKQEEDLIGWLAGRGVVTVDGGQVQSDSSRWSAICTKTDNSVERSQLMSGLDDCDVTLKTLKGFQVLDVNVTEAAIPSEGLRVELVNALESADSDGATILLHEIQWF